MKDSETEVAVVGAGPAGSTAAETLAKRGIDVVLIDRKSEIGSPVQCGGFLPETHELRSLLPRAMLPASLLDIPNRCILHRTRLQRIYSPSGKHKEFPVDGRVLDRRAFDRYLAYRAARAGATLLPKTRASLILPGLMLSGHRSGGLSADVIIGADGPSSTVARAAGISEASLVGVCIEYEMADVAIDPEAAEMYFGSKVAPGGYAWIIPLSHDLANVGVGVRVSHLTTGSKIRQVLDGFIHNHPVAKELLGRGEVLAVMRGVVPADGMPRSIQRESVLLAGDAAGQVMATSGGGIPLAMVAGRVAAEVAYRFLREGGSLDDYRSQIDIEIGREIANSVRIRRLVDRIMQNDMLLSALFSMLSPDQMKAIQRGQIPEALSRMISDLI